MRRYPGEFVDWIDTHAGTSRVHALPATVGCRWTRLARRRLGDVCCRPSRPCKPSVDRLAPVCYGCRPQRASASGSAWNPLSTAATWSEVNGGWCLTWIDSEIIVHGYLGLKLFRWSMKTITWLLFLLFNDLRLIHIATETTGSIKCNYAVL
jgi:hypothetical protein